MNEVRMQRTWLETYIDNGNNVIKDTELLEGCLMEGTFPLNGGHRHSLLEIIEQNPQVSWPEELINNLDAPIKIEKPRGLSISPEGDNYSDLYLLSPSILVEKQGLPDEVRNDIAYIIGMEILNWKGTFPGFVDMVEMKFRDKSEAAYEINRLRLRIEVANKLADLTGLTLHLEQLQEQLDSTGTPEIQQKLGIVAGHRDS